MQSFKIIKPVLPLAPYVRYYWILQIDSGMPVAERTLPVGCVQMVFHRGKRLFIKEQGLQPVSFICGQSLRFSDVVSTGKIEMVVVVFQPYTAKAFLRIPVNEFYGQNIPVDETDTELIDMAKRIEDALDADSCIYLIERFLIRRLYLFPEYNLKRMSAVLNEVDAYPQIKMSRLSEIACLENKQFSRIFSEYVGATPKDFMRIVRMQRALYIMQRNPDISFVQLACDCGFYDQSHMIKEFRLFSGYTPMEYISVCVPYSDYFSSME